MLYLYKCLNCSTTLEVERSIHAEVSAPSCADCGEIVFKNEEMFTNEYIKGTPDLLIKDDSGAVINVPDIKSSWDIHTFMNAKMDDISKEYYWQGQAEQAHDRAQGRGREGREGLPPAGPGRLAGGPRQRQHRRPADLRGRRVKGDPAADPAARAGRHQHQPQLVGRPPDWHSHGTNGGAVAASR